MATGAFTIRNPSVATVFPPFLGRIERHASKAHMCLHCGCQVLNEVGSNLHLPPGSFRVLRRAVTRGAWRARG